VTSRVRALHALANAYGVQRRWKTASGVQAVTGDEQLVVILRQLGAPISAANDAADALHEFQTQHEARILEPVLVQWGSRALEFDVAAPAASADAPLQFAVELEDGSTREWSARLNERRAAVPQALPVGVHTLHVRAGTEDGSATVLAAPRRLPTDRRRWGLFVPCYSLHDDAQADTGDLATFDRFARWAGSLGASVVGTLPILATYFGAGAEPVDTSPYNPVSRRHWNEVYLDVTAVPEVAPGTSVAEPSPGAYVDLVALAQRKRVALEAALTRLDESPARREAFERFVVHRPDVVRYARFRSATERGLALDDVGERLEHPVAKYHAYVQWLVERQLQTLKGELAQRGQELYLDLPIGSHPLGYDVVTETGLFARGASVGAPPDQFFALGQDWGFPPMLPHVARESGHRYLRACIAANVRVASRLRVDHVMGMHRLWWVPNGAAATEGAYVHYPADEQYAALLIEAARHGATVVGENLGTVPRETNRALRKHGMLGMHVVQFEFHADRNPPLRTPEARELSCLDTHDTATFATWWSDLEPAAQASLVAVLRAEAVLADGLGEVVPQDVLRALLAYLGTTPAEIVFATLEDLWLELDAQNVPGTTAEQHPNFRRRLARSLSELEASTDIANVVAGLAASRPDKQGAQLTTTGGRP
jgi:4-alpha-glucanotransferase